MDDPRSMPGAPADEVAAGRPVIVDLGSSAPFGHIRCRVPHVALVGDPPRGARRDADPPVPVWLVGDPAEWTASGALDELLRDFLLLAGAPDAAIVGFARRYGMLVGAPPAETPAETSADPGAAGTVPAEPGAAVGALPPRTREEPPGRRWTISEPLPAWGMLAGGLAGLLGLALDGDERDGVAAGAAVNAAVWLSRRPVGALTLVMLTEWDQAVRDYASPAGGAGRRDKGPDLVRRSFNALLGLAGVGPDAGLGSTGPSFAVGAVGPAEPEAGAAPRVWLVGGLLPLLVLQALRCAHTIPGDRCSRCKIFIPRRDGDRRPRRDQPFYGNHHRCRREALLESKRQAARRRRQRQKQAAGTGEAGGEAAG